MPPKLLPIALLFSAVGRSRHLHGVQALAPSDPSSLRPAFAPPDASSPDASAILLRAGRARASVRRRAGVARPLSSRPAEEGGDDAFFFRASQIAARERMQRVRDGREPLAVALSSAGRDAAGVATKKGGGPGATPGGEGRAPSPEVKVPVDPFLKKQRERTPDPDVKIPVDPFLKRRQEQQERIPKSTQSSATPTILEEGANSDDPGKDAAPSLENKALDSDTIDEILSSSFTTEEDRPKSGAGGNVLPSGPVADTTTDASLDSGKETTKTIEQQPPPAANGRPLSSDGKELFEPTDSGVDPQNVEMGLLVLTRSFLTLKSILEKEE